MGWSDADPRSRSDAGPAGTAGPDFAREARFLSQGCRLVAGVDEVGRGPLAGPVVAAAVVLDPDDLPFGIRDSKAMTPAAREAAFERIASGRAAIGLAAVPAGLVDTLNIRRASLLAMTRAVAALPSAPAIAIVDGRDCPEGLPEGCRAVPVVGGDRLVLSVAAASVIAKVVRDRLMAQAALAHPGYGFEQHKGYGTAAHLAALARLGPCPLHRRSFAPVRATAGEPA